MYRGGSIYCCEGCNSCQNVVRNAYSVGSTGDYYNNAGDYGSTSPVTIKSRNLDNFNVPRLRQGGSSIAIPLDDPRDYKVDSSWDDSNVPSVEQLLQQPRTPSAPGVMPTVPPTRPRVPTPTLDYSPIDTIPFSPSDEVVVPPVPDPFPADMDMEVPITLEELRRLDPSVQNFEIISIEDAGVKSPAR